MALNAKITFLICGSIAAYKSAYIVSRLAQDGADVFVGMTESAMRFIAPITFQTLSGNKVATSLFDEDVEYSVGHITLATQVDVVVVAPATANIIAKMAHGIADDLVSSILLATSVPVLFAPAMNVNMWDNPITQDNVSKLRSRGVLFVGPEQGFLACSAIGVGRLADESAIIREIRSLIVNK